MLRGSLGLIFCTVALAGLWVVAGDQRRGRDDACGDAAAARADAGLGRGPLADAASDGDVTWLGVLIERGADVHQRDGAMGMTALHHAAIGQHGAAIRALIAAGAEVDAASCGGTTPLMFACGCASLHGDRAAEAVDALLAAGADVNAHDRLGRTPLMFAMQSGELAVVRRLLAHGADRFARDHFHQTAADFADERATRGALEGTAAAAADNRLAVGG